MLKTALLNILPISFRNKLRNIKNAIFNKRKETVFITNYFKTDFNKKALISYITAPFITGIEQKHTNHLECYKIAMCLHQLGFSVDVVDFDSKNRTLDYQKYQLIFGFGDVLETAFYHIDQKKTLTIYYGTGNHYFFINPASVNRLQEVYEKTGVLMLKSIRFAESMWTLQTTLSTGLIVLGNDFTANTFQKYYHKGLVKPIPASFHHLHTPDFEKKDFESAKKHFLWFGSNGALHKGLDILLFLFSKRKDIVLHVCGANPYEDAFFTYFNDYLYKTSNIINHQFVDIKSEAFKNILNICAFVVFPSASEGGCASVVTVMGNGGLIPIVSVAACLDVAHLGDIFAEISEKSVEESIDKMMQIPNDKLKIMSQKVFDQINEIHHIDKYEKTMSLYIKDIVDKNTHINEK